MITMEQYFIGFLVSLISFIVAVSISKQGHKLVQPWIKAIVLLTSVLSFFICMSILSNLFSNAVMISKAADQAIIFILFGFGIYKFIAHTKAKSRQ
ncbi:MULTISPECIES: hypothetical protein [Pseudoalteromonas]|uniref:hypothetical protein n=2 Tax=Pseudoalteromonas TaxID=53246 RepID=UPI00029AEBD8|nr:MULTISPECIES: hypothetical protein [Pseudoalteromonas]AUJ70098.1 hypothetical protein PNC201_09025 [Pseudoalteromonas sp. NC201]MCF2827844.1 hypothetical protein [Pseudoalteromonas sp. OF5H-5]MCF2925954.1 hypothetical protein [Pseudoalteromonas sp. DL2-H1]MCG7553764.1 hypothetical protein [Pseudoalteromonas sp. Of11M-6]MCX2765366.1 hypothetical protein [Pseudoalteromonas sp. B530]